MFWSKLSKSNRNCAWNLALIKFLLYGICVNIFIMNRCISKNYTRSKSTIYRAGAAAVPTISSYTIEVGSKLTTLFVYFFNSQNQRAKAGSMAFRSRNFHAIYLGAGNGVSSGTHEIGIFTRSEIKGWPDVKFCAHAQCVLPRCSSRYFITWLPIHTRLSLVPTLSRLGQTCSLP